MNEMDFVKNFMLPMQAHHIAMRLVMILLAAGKPVSVENALELAHSELSLAPNDPLWPSIETLVSEIEASASRLRGQAHSSKLS